MASSLHPAVTLALVLSDGSLPRNVALETSLPSNATSTKSDQPMVKCRGKSQRGLTVGLVARTAFAVVDVNASIFDML